MRGAQPPDYPETRSGERRGDRACSARIISNSSSSSSVTYKATAAQGSEFNKIIQKGDAIVDVGFGKRSCLFCQGFPGDQNLPLGTFKGKAVSQDSHCGRTQQAYRGDVDNELLQSSIRRCIFHIINRNTMQTAGNQIRTIQYFILSMWLDSHPSGIRPVLLWGHDGIRFALTSKRTWNVPDDKLDQCITLRSDNIRSQQRVCVRLAPATSL